MPPRVDRERNRCSGEASGRIFVRNRIGDVLACEMLLVVGWYPT
jgi:hypothetical protein